MHYWDSWHMGWMMIAWVLALAVIAGLIWAAARSGLTSSVADPPEQILKRRYAKGEIDHDTFERMLADLKR